MENEILILNELHRDLYKKLGHKDRTYKLFCEYYSHKILEIKTKTTNESKK